jgi:hypothetical protein
MLAESNRDMTLAMAADRHEPALGPTSCVRRFGQPFLGAAMDDVVGVSEGIIEGSHHSGR